MKNSGQKSVMISSTALDLPDHRKQVFEACTNVEYFPIGMESLPARDADAVQMSLEMVNKADIYIGIFANRYGHIPQGHNISITELEFNRAVERRIPILIFIAHKEHLFTADAIETTPGAQTKLKRLKILACKGRGRCEFRSPTELRGQVIHALSDIRKLQAQQLQQQQRQMAAASQPVISPVPPPPSLTLPEPSWVNQIKLGGINGTSDHRFAVINGKTFEAGDTAVVKIAGKSITIHCLGIRETSVSISLDGIDGTRDLKLSDN